MDRIRFGGLSSWVSNQVAPRTRAIIRTLDYETNDCRLVGHAYLLRVRAGHRLCAQAVHENKHGLFPLGPIDSGLDSGTGVSFSEPRSAGSYRYGRVGSKVRDRDKSFLLDRCGPGDGVSRSVHDAVLLRLA